MKERKTQRFAPYDLTPEWFDKVCLLNPNSPSFTSELISEKEETHVEHDLIGYNDVMEYMMCNDGEYPPDDVPCHGETEPVNVTEKTYRMYNSLASLVRTFCLQSSGLEAFCQFLVSNGVNLVTDFANVSELYKIGEISAKHIPKKMFVFPNNIRVNRPRFWICTSVKSYSNYANYAVYSTLLVVQPNRYEQKYLDYEFTTSKTVPSDKNFVIKPKKKKFYVSETRRTNNVIVVANSSLYLLTI